MLYRLITMFLSIVVLDARCFADQQSDKLVSEFISQAKQERAQYKTIVDSAKLSFNQHHKKLGQNQTSSANQDNPSVISEVFGNNGFNKEDRDQGSDILIFVSFSMPQKMLWHYFEQAKLYNAKLIIRGLVNNSFKDTVKAMDLGDNKILKLEVNPKLFKEYQIQRVPTIVITSLHNGYNKFIGSVSLKYALDEINNREIR